jgi:TonB family protein
LWANPADHEAVRNQWLSTVATHPGDSPVLVFAVTFLQVEDKDDAERALQRALDAAPDNREIAARLGFLYAMEILGVDSMVRGARPSGQPPDLAPHAIAELERTSNPFVLAAAGTALPNLAIPGGDPKIFEIASGLSARARELAPADDPDLSGPMPMIRYFIAAQQESGPSRGLAPVMAASPATQIRIAPDVQATKLIRSVTPQYPEEARKAGIVGNVVFTVTLATDGSVQSLQVLSGHRLLVFAATEALKHWLYKPTFLNNVPVEVVTEVTISFPGQ